MIHNTTREEVCCSVLQCVTVRYSVWQCVTELTDTQHHWKRCVAVRCSGLWCVAVCGSVLQRVAELADAQHHLEEVCCSVLQCVAVRCARAQETWQCKDPARTCKYVALCEEIAQHTATHCNTLQHAATHCNTHTRTGECVALCARCRQGHNSYMYLLMYVYTHAHKGERSHTYTCTHTHTRTGEYVALCEEIAQHTATRCNTLQHAEHTATRTYVQASMWHYARVAGRDTTRSLLAMPPETQEVCVCVLQRAAVRCSVLQCSAVCCAFRSPCPQKHKRCVCACRVGGWMSGWVEGLEFRI